MAIRMTRRDLLRWGIVLGGGAVLPAGRRVSRADDLPSSPRTDPFLDALPIPPITESVGKFNTFPKDPGNCVNPDGTTAFHVGFHGPNPLPANTEFFLIHEKQVLHSFHTQLPENFLWGYEGMIPGPTFVARSGTPQLVRFVNDLPANDPVGIGEPITAIHRHGGFQNPEDDGYPLDTFCSGQARDYYYPNRPDAGLLENEHSTNWYHDHAIDITGPNVYRGLAGFYLYQNSFDTGDEAMGLKLPANKRGGVDVGPFDIGLVIQDKRFDASGRLVYNTFDHNGFLGDKFLVNGKIQPFLNVERRKYRFRFLNGSNARVYQLFLSPASNPPFLAIATDSHLLEHPLPVQSLRISPAERVEVIVDFRNAPSEVFLVNRLQQTDGRKPDGLVSPGTRILKFVVNPKPAATDSPPIPANLLPVSKPRNALVADLLKDVKVQRRFKFERSHGAWVINGEFFDENRVNAKPRVRQPEIWILESGGGWVHPVHIHLSEFFILSRDGKTPPPLEQGRKETVLIGGDVGDAKILIEFEDPRDVQTPNTPLRYVFHCHNIEHEDMRMMGQFEVQT